MKITYIRAEIDEDDAIKTTISLGIDTDLAPAEAISSVLALFSADRGISGTGSPASAYENISDAELQAAVAATKAAEAPATEPKAEAKATRTRRPRTNPDAAKAVEIPEHVPQKTEEELAAQTQPTERRRTRTTQEPAAETVKVITDADLAKACSNAAAIIGIEVVQAVINDFAVKSMQELAPDVREKFLGELDDEITLAKEELAKVGK